MRCPLLLTVLCLSTSYSLAQDWNTYQGSNERTGRVSFNVNPANLHPLWQTGPEIIGPKIVGGNLVAFYSGSGGPKLKNFNATTGQLIWTKSFNFGPTPVSVSGNYIAYASGTQGATTMEVARLDTGQVLASVSGLDSTSAPPLLKQRNDGSLDVVLATTNGAKKFTFTGDALVQNWSKSMQNGGFVSPSLIGNSVLFAGVGHYYSVDLTSGEMNTFHAGGISGGGGSFAAVDAARQRFYIQELYDDQIFGALTAYQFNSNSSIQQIWQRTRVEWPNGPALLPNGDLITSNRGHLLRIDGSTGNLLVDTGDIGANIQSSVISGNYVFVGTQSGLKVLSTQSLAPAFSLPGNLAAGNMPERNVVAISDRFFASFSTTGTEGMRVYGVPEPSSLLALTLASGAIFLRARRRGSSHANALK